MYVIKRTDQGGGYVAPAGSDKSYTHTLENAKMWRTRENADRERCVGNEIVLNLDELFQRNCR